MLVDSSNSLCNIIVNLRDCHWPFLSDAHDIRFVVYTGNIISTVTTLDCVFRIT